MILENPILDTLRDLRVESDKNPKDWRKKAELMAMEEKNREIIQQRLEKLYSGVEKVTQQAREVKTEYPSARQQYKHACRIYKESVRLQSDIRDLKKELRIELGIDKSCKGE